MESKIACVCGCTNFENERNEYIVTSDIDDPRGGLILIADCIQCGKTISLV